MFDQLVIGCPLNILAVGWFRTMSDDVGCCWMMLMLDIGEAPQWTCTLLVNVSRHWFYAVWLLWCVSIQASWNLFRAIDNYPLEYHQNICMCQQIRPPKDLSRSRNHQASDPINELNRSINNVHIYIYMITASRGFTSMARVALSHDGKDMDAGGARERGEPQWRAH